MYEKTLFKCSWPDGATTFVLARDADDALRQVRRPGKRPEPQREWITIPEDFGVHFSNDPDPVKH